jgi:hypothetical protein
VIKGCVKKKCGRKRKEAKNKNKWGAQLNL